ncbi:RDD family protein [Streptomyces sp. NPDC051567]|uniref:RDD family protein n=1 Tax=Streptomyces sp. NPDC051567 TaxID=3365660 RepID=UPI00378CF1CE
MGTLTASPGDGEHAAREGYYPDPSIPGYVRYWNGASWVPGTSRPATRADETGPVFLDATSATEALPDPDPGPAGWQADPAHQSGFGGPRDHRVSWGGPPEPDPGHAPARPAGISLGRGPRPEPLEFLEAAEPDLWATGPSLAHAAAGAERFPDRAPAGHAAGAHAAGAPVPAGWVPAGHASGARTAGPHGRDAQAPGLSSPAGPGPRGGDVGGLGILSARSPAAPPRAPAPEPAPGWPAAPGGAGSGATGVTSSWPEAAPGAPGPARPGHGHGPGPVRPGHGPASTAPAAPRTSVRRLVEDSWPEPDPVEEPRPEPAGPVAGAGTSRPEATAPRPEADRRAEFERMAERAVRPAGLPRRAVARALDCLVLGAVAAAVARPFVPAVTAHVEAKVAAARATGRTTTVWLLDPTVTGYLGLVLGAVFLFGVLYEALPTARWGRTPGKKLLGVRVLATATLRPPSFGAALRRWLVCVLLGLPGGLWCLVDRPRRQSWHDKAARTYVAR